MPNLNFELPTVIAHRGESGNAPENTLSAIELAAKGGATWVELDINISVDNICYVHHDDNIDRCTNGTGFLMKHRSEYLDSLDAGSWFDKSFVSEPLPRLSAVAKVLQKHQMGLNLEIKPSVGWDEPTAEAVASFIESQWPAELPLLLSSFSERAVRTVQTLLPNVPRGMIVSAIPRDWPQQLEELECSTLHCAGDLLTEKLARDIRAAGYELLCWTVNEPKDAKRLLDWGVNSVFTDYPTSMQVALQDAL